MASCNPCGTTKPKNVELRVQALESRVYARSNSGQFHGFYSQNDTLDLDSISEWYVQLKATGPQIALEPTTQWRFFPQAVACEPVPPYVYTRQTATGIEVFSSAAFNASRPAGGKVTDMFFDNPANNAGWGLHVELAEHGIGRLLQSEWYPLNFYLRYRPNPGTISQFTIELYIDSDTLRSATPFIRF